MYNEKYESCLYDNYDGGICAVVNVNRYAMSVDQRDSRFMEDEEDRDFNRKFDREW